MARAALPPPPEGQSGEAGPAGAARRAPGAPRREARRALTKADHGRKYGHGRPGPATQRHEAPRAHSADTYAERGFARHLRDVSELQQAAAAAGDWYNRQLDIGVWSAVAHHGRTTECIVQR